MSKVIADLTYQKLINYLSHLDTQEAKELLNELRRSPSYQTSHGSYVLDDSKSRGQYKA